MSYMPTPRPRNKSRQYTRYNHWPPCPRLNHAPYPPRNSSHWNHPYSIYPPDMPRTTTGRLLMYTYPPHKYHTTTCFHMSHYAPPWPYLPHKRFALRCSLCRHICPRQHSSHIQTVRMRRHHCDSPLGTAPARCCWTCNNRWTQSCTMSGLRHPDIAFHHCTRYKMKMQFRLLHCDMSPPGSLSDLYHQYSTYPQDTQCTMYHLQTNHNTPQRMTTDMHWMSHCRYKKNWTACWNRQCVHNHCSGYFPPCC